MVVSHATSNYTKATKPQQHAPAPQLRRLFAYSTHTLIFFTPPTASVVQNHLTPYSASASPPLLALAAGDRCQHPLQQLLSQSATNKRRWLHIVKRARALYLAPTSQSQIRDHFQKRPPPQPTSLPNSIPLLISPPTPILSQMTI